MSADLNRIGQVDLDEAHFAFPDVRPVVSVGKVSRDDHDLAVVGLALLQDVDVQKLGLDVRLLNAQQGSVKPSTELTPIVGSQISNKIRPL